VVTFSRWQQARDHVGDLDPGVVEIVLDLHRVPEVPKRAHEDVSEEGISQMADVGRLVRVDVGVLDDDLALARDGVGTPARNDRTRVPRSRKKLR
jgi:hypothetical protein